MINIGQYIETLIIQLMSVYNYFGEEVWKPYIGNNERPLTTEDMRIAVRINRSVEWIMVIIVVATATCMYVIPSFF